jgi:hypothetical protein
MVWNYKMNSSHHRWEDIISVPVVTLYRRVKKKGGVEVVSKKGLDRFRNVLTQKQEN